MVLQFFVFGRNPELSRAELVAYLDARGQTNRELFIDSGIGVFEVDNFVDINELGGCVHSGTIDLSGEDYEVESYIMSELIVESEKFSYSVLGNCDVDVFKAKFKAERLKATFRSGRRSMRLQSSGVKNSRGRMRKVGLVLLPSADYAFLLTEYGGIWYFGRVTDNYSSSEVSYRDMHKPVRREALAISPRLAKILINLSGAKPGDTLLDCFCGIGGIVQEAVLLHINAVGVDLDKVAIANGRKNLRWIENRYPLEVKWTLEQGDARRLSRRGFDCVATETPLGVLLKKRPTPKVARKIVADFTRMIIPVLRELGVSIEKEGRIAITFPRVLNEAVDCHEVAEKAGLKIVVDPILEQRDKQFVGRDIIVFSNSVD